MCNSLNTKPTEVLASSKWWAWGSLGFLGAKPQVRKADLGVENAFHYNHELNRWVEKDLHHARTSSDVSSCLSAAFARSFSTDSSSSECSHQSAVDGRRTESCHAATVPSRHRSSGCIAQHNSVSPNNQGLQFTSCHAASASHEPAGFDWRSNLHLDALADRAVAECLSLCTMSSECGDSEYPSSEWYADDICEEGDTSGDDEEAHPAAPSHAQQLKHLVQQLTSTLACIVPNPTTHPISATVALLTQQLTELESEYLIANCTTTADSSLTLPSIPHTLAPAALVPQRTTQELKPQHIQQEHVSLKAVNQPPIRSSPFLSDDICDLDSDSSASECSSPPAAPPTPSKLDRMDRLMTLNSYSSTSSLDSSVSKLVDMMMNKAASSSALSSALDSDSASEYETDDEWGGEEREVELVTGTQVVVKREQERWFRLSGSEYEDLLVALGVAGQQVERLRGELWRRGMRAEAVDMILEEIERREVLAVA